MTHFKCEKKNTTMRFTLILLHGSAIYFASNETLDILLQLNREVLLGSVYIADISQALTFCATYNISLNSIQVSFGTIQNEPERLRK